MRYPVKAVTAAVKPENFKAFMMIIRSWPYFYEKIDVINDREKQRVAFPVCEILYLFP